MADHGRVHHVLAPFLQLPPEHTQTLITGVLGASANWLIVQYLGTLLGPTHNRSRVDGHDSRDAGASPSPANDPAVLLVSWMRDWDFWRRETRRSVGIDLQQAYQDGRFVFVDGLTRLFVPSERTDPPPSRKIDEQSLRSSTPPHAGPLILAQSGQIDRHPVLLEKATLDHLVYEVTRAVSNLKASGATEVMLLLDAPSILLQTTKPPISTLSLSKVLLDLRGQVHSLTLALPADDPFLAVAADMDLQNPDQEARRTTPLDTDNAAFITGVAHQSQLLMQCRRLDTGWAEDVSGVLRITRRCLGRLHESGEGQASEEGEWLYHFAVDGSVKVWSRGSST